MTQRRGIHTVFAMVFLALAILPLDVSAGNKSPSFPSLSGRIVDEAHLLSPQTVKTLDDQLETHEKTSGHQIVVATVSSLQGYDIETYTNLLFNTWSLGQKDKNDGVLLVIAPSEKALRIEVGYGLEGTLPDVIASRIIQQRMTPLFKQGQMEQGVVAGVDSILQVLGGNLPEDLKEKPFDWFTFLLGTGFFLGLFIVFILIEIFSKKPPGSSPPSNRSGGQSHSSSSSSFSSSSSSGSSFSGGGGRSGGGGASGRW